MVGQAQLETIGRLGLLGLWILGRKYKLGHDVCLGTRTALVSESKSKEFKACDH